MIHKWIYVLFLLLLTYNLNADSSIVLNLKNGSIVETKVLEIAEWGIKLEDKKSVSYKVISNIEINDTSYVHEILNYVPLAQIYLEDNNYNINFDGVLFDKREVKEYRLLQNVDISSHILFNSNEIFNIQSSIKPRNFYNIAIRLGFSFGWDYNNYVENDVKFEDFVRTYSWNAGLGRLFRFNDSFFTIFINLGKKYIDFEKEEDDSRNKFTTHFFSDERMIYFACSSYRYYIYKNDFYMTLGMQYYINDISFDSEELKIKENNNIVLKLGIGHSF